mgnify:CR=1 FL=1
MASKPKNTKSTPKTNQFLFPLLFIAVVVVAVILIIFVTQGSKSDSFTEESGIDPFATPYLVATKQYSAEPPMLIDPAKTYTATFNMEKGGSFEIELYAEKAPKTVNSFVFLAREGYFDGVTFHRVLEDFMAQGGDPTGTGMGGPGYKFEYEDSGYAFDKAGVVAMANAGPRTATNGSQFFITFGPNPSLDGDYTIFGQVVSGMDVVNGITLRDPQKSPDYEGDIIESITIREE